MRQPLPLADGQIGGHLHQPLYEVELLLLWVANGQVATVHVHLPGHLLRTAQFHLETESQLILQCLYQINWRTLV